MRARVLHFLKAWGTGGTAEIMKSQILGSSTSVEILFPAWFVTNVPGPEYHKWDVQKNYACSVRIFVLSSSLPKWSCHTCCGFFIYCYKYSYFCDKYRNSPKLVIQYIKATIAQTLWGNQEPAKTIFSASRGDLELLECKIPYSAPQTPQLMGRGLLRLPRTSSRYWT